MDVADSKEVRKFIRSIKARLPIDREALEEECVRQPLLYEEVAAAASKAKSNAKKAKEEAEITAAELNLDIRRNTEKYIGEGIKVTESVISNTIFSNKKYLAAKDEWLKTEEISSSLDSLQRTVEQRKSMLRDLVTLFTFRYYEIKHSEPIKSKEINRATEDQVNSLRDGIRQRRLPDSEEENDNQT